MKVFGITVIVAALFLLYKIAFPEQKDIKTGREDKPSGKENNPDVIGKSKFVRSERSQPQTTAAMTEETDNQHEKADIFAEKKKENAVIPDEELDEVFEENFEIEYSFKDGNAPDDLPHEDEEVDEDEEDLRRRFRDDVGLAGGLSYEELGQAVDTVNSASFEANEDTAKVLTELEKTDLFEQLVSGNADKELRIRNIIDRNVQEALPETGENDTNEYGDVNITDFLS